MEILIIILVIIDSIYSLFWFKKYQRIIDRQAKKIVDLKEDNITKDLIIKKLEKRK